MRVWLVSPGELDNQRLLGAHNEVHMALGLIKHGLKTGKMNTLVKPWCDGKGIAALLRYHTYVVMEMEKRGWTGHKTPFQVNEIDEKLSGEALGCIGTNEYRDYYWPPDWCTQDDIDKDRAELQKRQRAEGKKVGLQ